MTCQPLDIHAGRGRQDVLLVSRGTPFFTERGYCRVFNSVALPGLHAFGFFKLRCYALEKFTGRAPGVMLQWLRDNGGVFALNVVGLLDDADDAPGRADGSKMRLIFADPNMPLLFKLTVGGLV